MPFILTLFSEFSPNKVRTVPKIKTEGEIQKDSEKKSLKVPIYKKKQNCYLKPLLQQVCISESS